MARSSRCQDLAVQLCAIKLKIQDYEFLIARLSLRANGGYAQYLSCTETTFQVPSDCVKTEYLFVSTPVMVCVSRTCDAPCLPLAVAEAGADLV